MGGEEKKTSYQHVSNMHLTFILVSFKHFCYVEIKRFVTTRSLLREAIKKDLEINYLDRSAVLNRTCACNDRLVGTSEE